MTPFATRYLPVALISLLLAACQHRPSQPYEPPVDERVAAFRQLEQSLNGGNLESAESQLATLQRNAAGDTRLEQYQRQLAEAYLQQGQAALQNNDLDAAAKALSHARSLMPNAPALATGLDGALNQAREAEKQAAERAARETAARNEQARRLQEAAERQAQAIQATQLPGAPQEEKPAPAKPGARLIDPAAASSAVPLPMLDSQDNDILRELLDAVAADVVAFDCAVRVEVRQAKDYPWVAALLSARVKKLDPAFGLRLSQSLKPEQVPRLVLSPRR